MIELKRGAVVHVVPGRVRVKLERDELAADSGDELRSALLAMPGIREVQLNRRTGSLVIRYDPAELDAPELIELARAANLLALDALAADRSAARRMPPSQIAQRIQRTFGEVDVRLAELTNGRWDLRTVVPFVFGTLAARQILRDFGQVGAAPWYVFAWYAYDSFWKMNHDRQHPDPNESRPPPVPRPAQTPTAGDRSPP